MDSAVEMRVDAELCLEGGGLDTASNRLYYACFRAAQAALVSVGVEPPKTHKGTRMLFRKHLVDTGRVHESVGATLDKMEEYRLLADYSETNTTKDEVLAALQHVDVFLDTIRTELLPGYEVSDKNRERKAQIEQFRVQLRREPRGNRRSDPTTR